MELHFTEKGSAAVVEVTGRMDGTTAPMYEKECEQGIGAEIKFVVVDLEMLEYMSSAGLRGILRVAKKGKSEGQETVLCGAHGMVENLLRMTGFYSMFRIFKTQAEALQGVAPEA